MRCSESWAARVADIGLVLLLSALGTYLWRGLGVLLSGRISVNGEFFTWVTCVTYAMIAGLVMRIVVMPSGLLATSLTWHRLLACVLGLAAYYVFRRNLLLAVTVGAGSLIVLNYLR
jgi:branched-subunit amino acid transport protein